MSATDIEYSYCYRQSSRLLKVHSAPSQLSLATSNGEDNPYFFDSSLSDVPIFAEAVLCLANIVRTHYFLHSPGLLDPVVTCGPDGLRFEGFSSCCGVYVQCMFGPGSFNNPMLGRGTTNVDINEPLRNGLAKLRSSDQVRLSVGSKSLSLQTGSARFVEKKVRLPIRWLRGFCEVQSYLAKAKKCLTLPVSQMLRFVRGLPRNAARSESVWTVPSGNSLRLTTRQTDSSVKIVGTERLRAIEPLLRMGRGNVTLYADRASGVTAWNIDLESCQFMIALSPGMYRGFSGEGQVLESLADSSWQNVLDQVKAQLNFNGNIDPRILADELNVSAEETRMALDTLADHGLVGYDVSSACYFHRVLPFPSASVETLQPRFVAARKLLVSGAVSLHKSISTTTSEWLVTSTTSEHIVVVSEKSSRCTCIWHSKYQGLRGPCKHILAAQMKSIGETECPK